MSVIESPLADVATTDWVRCPGCAWLVYAKRLARNLHVCPECGHHQRLGARQRIVQLADPDSFSELGSDIAADDPLGFVDRRAYRERLAEAVAGTGEREAAVFGTATVDGHRIVLLAMDFAFMGGSMGCAVGEAIVRAAERAAMDRCPLVLVCASGGARMQEGVLSLMQMAKTSQAMGRLHDAGILSICVLTDPTFGGVTASFATLGSILVAETGALVGFAGPRVIAQTIRQQLPPGFQNSEFLMAHGLVDRVEPRAGLRPLLARLCTLHTPPDELAAPRAQVKGDRHDPSARGPATDDERAPVEDARDPWDIVTTARDIARPTARDYFTSSFDDFVELHGDRCSADDPAIVGGVARIGGRSVVVVGHQKGHSTKELVAANFGMPHPEGYRKVLRLLAHAERLDLPVVTLVDTPGAYPGIEAEERGQSAAIAQTVMRSSQLPVPVVCVVTGEGGSGGALALATGDRLLMLANSFYSVISPEGCAAILWRTAEAAPTAARTLRVTARDLLRLGVADAVIPEPPGGAQADPAGAAANLRRAVVDSLDELAGLDRPALLAARYHRFRTVGRSPA
jgi:acyl-CoA carboxylase subunit beta